MLSFLESRGKKRNTSDYVIFIAGQRIFVLGFGFKEEIITWVLKGY